MKVKKDLFAFVLVGIGVIIILPLMVLLDQLTHGEALNIAVLSLLALLTAFYARETKKIATATEKAKFASFRPILKIDEHINEILLTEISEHEESCLFLPFWHCVVRNIGVGPALKVKYSVLVGDAESTIWESQVLETKEKVEEMQDSFTPEITPENSEGMICVEYEDIFGNIFQSTRQLVLEKAKFVIGPLELYEIEQEKT
jgi:hypothetical protein